MKKFVYKIFDNDGTFIRALPVRLPVKPETTDELVLNNPSIISSINGGQGQLTVNLDTKFDDFDEGVSIKLNNIIKLFVIDQDNPLGKLIYTGIIQNYNPFLSRDTEGVKIIATSRISELSKALYKSGASRSFTKSSIKASDLFKDIIDHFRTVYTDSDINYSVSSVEDSVTLISYDFENDTWKSAIDKTLTISPTTFWWGVFPDSTTGNLLAEFKCKPSSATHTFIVNKHVDELTVNTTMEPVINRLFLETSVATATFQDATSQTDFNIVETVINDQNITDTTTRDASGNSFIANNKDEKKRVLKLTINNSFDNIEDIKPGDTCKVLGFKIGNTPLSDNMQIVRTQYDGTVIRLTLEEDILNFAKQVQTTSKLN